MAGLPRDLVYAPVSVLDPALIRVLLVPLGRISQSQFNRYAQLLKQHRAICPREKGSNATPELASTEAMIPKVYFKFAEAVAHEYDHLAHLQTHRQVLGVIGIMQLDPPSTRATENGTDGAAKSAQAILEAGHEQFLTILEKFPTALVSRCFAFREASGSGPASPAVESTPPRERLPRLPSVRGVLLVDLEGQTGSASNIGSIMTNFAQTMVAALETMTAGLETQHYIPPSSLSVMTNTPAGGASHPTQRSPTFASFFKQQLSVGPRGQSPSQDPTSGNLPADIRHQSAAPAAASSPLSLSSLLSPAATKRSSALLPNTQQGQQSRSLGKIKKLMGDTCLLAGKLTEAISHYSSSIEHSQTYQDHLWQAAAFEGYNAALLLLTFRASERALLMALLSNPLPSLASGVLPADNYRPPSTPPGSQLSAAALSYPSTHPTSGTNGTGPNPSPPTASLSSPGTATTNPAGGNRNRASTKTNTSVLQSSLKNSTQLAYFVLSEITDKYREIPVLYEQSHIFSITLHIEACLRMAHLILLVRQTGFTENTLHRLVQSVTQSPAASQIPPTASPKLPKITKAHITEWALRGWNEDAIMALSVREQLLVIQRLVPLFYTTGLYRKMGFFLYQFVSIAGTVLDDTPTRLPGTTRRQVDSAGRPGPVLGRVYGEPFQRAIDRLLAVYQMSRFEPMRKSPDGHQLIFDPFTVLRATEVHLQTEQSLITTPGPVYSELNAWRSLQIASLSEAVKLTGVLDMVQTHVVLTLMLICRQLPPSTPGTQGDPNAEPAEFNLVQLAHQLHLTIRQWYHVYPPLFTGIPPARRSMPSPSPSASPAHSALPLSLSREQWYALRPPTKSSPGRSGTTAIPTLGLPLRHSPVLQNHPVARDLFARLLVAVTWVIPPDPGRLCHRYPRAPYWQNLLASTAAANAAAAAASSHDSTTPEAIGGHQSVPSTPTLPVDPFIYNPYVIDADTGAHPQSTRHSLKPGHMACQLVADEPGTFAVHLHNPFPFALEITDIRLTYYLAPVEGEPGQMHSPAAVPMVSPLTQGVPTVLNPQQSRIFHLTVTLPTAHPIMVMGCVVTLFSHLQVHLIPPAPAKPTSSESLGTRVVTLERAGPVEVFIPTIIPALPYFTALSSSSSSLTDDNPIALFAGQNLPLQLTFLNSGATPVNYLHVDFFEPNPNGAPRRLLPGLLEEPPIRYLGRIPANSAETPSSHPLLTPAWAPGDTHRLAFMIHGQPDYHCIEIRITYGWVDPNEPTQENVYLRRVTLPIDLEIRPSLSALRLNVLPLDDLLTPVVQGPSPALDSSLPLLPRAMTYLNQLGAQLSLGPSTRQLADAWCLLQLDVTNPCDWAFQFTVVVDPATWSNETLAMATDGTSPLVDPSVCQAPVFTLEETCPPGQVCRLMIPFPRFRLPDEVINTAIPVAPTRRQFVRDEKRPQPTADELQRQRVAYWYRKELDRHLSITWCEAGSTYRGKLSLGTISIPAPQLIQLSRPEVLIDASVRCTAAPTPNDLASPLTSPGGQFAYPVDSPVSVQLTLTNPTELSLSIGLFAFPCGAAAPAPELTALIHWYQQQRCRPGRGHRYGSPSLPPSPFGRPGGSATTAKGDNSSSILWSEQPHFPFPAIAPGDTTTMTMPLYFTERGDYVVYYGWINQRTLSGGSGIRRLRFVVS